MKTTETKHFTPEELDQIEQLASGYTRLEEALLLVKYIPTLVSMARKLEEVQKEIEPRQWIRTSDKLPEHDDAVLAFAKGEGIVMAYYLHACNYTKVRWWSDDTGAIEPTHWMPLPELPQTENHELPTAESNAE